MSKILGFDSKVLSVSWWKSTEQYGEAIRDENGVPHVRCSKVWMPDVMVNNRWITNRKNIGYSDSVFTEVWKPILNPHLYTLCLCLLHGINYLANKILYISISHSFCELIKYCFFCWWLEGIKDFSSLWVVIQSQIANSENVCTI